MNSFFKQIQLIAFDLDDTLYPEIEFVKSGFRAVARFIEKNLSLNEDVYMILWGLFCEGERQKTFNKTLYRLGFGYDSTLIEEMIQTYRKHKPDITLYPDAKNILISINGKKKVALLTDGNLKTQKHKVSALSIGKYFDLCVFTDEKGKDAWKPNTWGYKKMMDYFSLQGNQCVYVGDNPLKDFVGAKSLGWRTVRIIRSEGLYRNVKEDEVLKADYTIENLEKLKELILTEET